MGDQQKTARKRHAPETQDQSWNSSRGRWRSEEARTVGRSQSGRRGRRPDRMPWGESFDGKKRAWKKERGHKGSGEKTPTGFVNQKISRHASGLINERREERRADVNGLRRNCVTGACAFCIPDWIELTKNKGPFLNKWMNTIELPSNANMFAED